MALAAAVPEPSGRGGEIGGPSQSQWDPWNPDATTIADLLGNLEGNILDDKARAIYVLNGVGENISVPWFSSQWV